MSKQYRENEENGQKQIYLSPKLALSWYKIVALRYSGIDIEDEIGCWYKENRENLKNVNAKKG